MNKFNEIILGSRKINQHSMPYIIAEIGVNHNCNMEIAKKQIDLAKKGGASAVKFQTYKANLIASKFSPSYWDLNEEKTNSQFKLFSRYDKFDKNFYKKVQRGFIKLSTKKPKKYLIVNSNLDIKTNEKLIIKKIKKLI